MRFTSTPVNRKYGNTMMRAKAEPRGAVERRLDQRRGDAAERHLGPAEAHALPQHARELGDVGIGVGVVGAAADDEEQRVARGTWRGARRSAAAMRSAAASSSLGSIARSRPKRISMPGLSAAKLLISQGRSFLTWLAANSMPGTARMRRAPRAASASSPSRIAGRANSR